MLVQLRKYQLRECSKCSRKIVIVYALCSIDSHSRTATQFIKESKECFSTFLCSVVYCILIWRLYKLFETSENNPHNLLAKPKRLLSCFSNLILVSSEGFNPTVRMYCMYGYKAERDPRRVDLISENGMNQQDMSTSKIL